MKLPPYLNKGDEVRIVSTARKISKSAVSYAIEIMTGWGLNVSVSKNAFAESHQFAGTVSQRTTDLQEALNDKNVKAIWCSRGGYGTVQILDHLDFRIFNEAPKWIIGYSDVTALLMHAISKHKISGIHATMPISVTPLLTINNTALLSLKNSLFGVENQYLIEDNPLNINGDFNGTLFGGNLSMLYSLLGSNSISPIKDGVLFIEDLDEYLYHIDRMVMNLKRNGVFNNLKGMLVGGLTNMHDNEVSFGKNAEEIVHSHVAGFEFPVYFGFPVGHQEKNYSLKVGSYCSMKNNLFSN